MPKSRTSSKTARKVTKRTAKKPVDVTAGNWPQPIELTVHRGGLVTTVVIDRME